MYKVIALFGKAGSGKDSIMREVVRQRPSLFHEIVNCTTRPKREGEKDGANYYYLSVKEFTDLIEENKILEYSQFNHWFYGTPRSSLSNTKINIGVFNPDGIRSLMKCDNIDLTVYHINCGDKERLLRQLEREAEPNVKEIIRRFTSDEVDFNRIYDIPFMTIMNSNKQKIEDGARKIIQECVY